MSLLAKTRFGTFQVLCPNDIAYGWFDTLMRGAELRPRPEPANTLLRLHCLIVREKTANDALLFYKNGLIGTLLHAGGLPEGEHEYDVEFTFDGSGEEGTYVQGSQWDPYHH